MEEFLHSEAFVRSDYEIFQPLSKQPGAHVFYFEDTKNKKDRDVFKTETRVRKTEEIGLNLVKLHTDVPVPDVGSAFYGADGVGNIFLRYIPGTSLTALWDQLDDTIKECLCHDTWNMIEKFRQIPKPFELQHLFLCLADGSYSHDVLIKDHHSTEQPELANDEEIRNHIYKRYYHNCGRKYEKELPDMLPRSGASVLTHSDIAPRNLIIDPDTHRIAGVIDWENCGRYPDYWEYANIMKPSRDQCSEWIGLPRVGSGRPESSGQMDI